MITKAQAEQAAKNRFYLVKIAPRSWEVYDRVKNAPKSTKVREASQHRIAQAQMMELRADYVDDLLDDAE